MASNKSPNMLRHQQETVDMSTYHHHHGGGTVGVGGGGGCSMSSQPSPSRGVQQPPTAAGAASCSYSNHSNNVIGGGSGGCSGGGGGGVLESSYNNTGTATTRFQPNLHGISMDWTPEEQAILDKGLATYATESTIACYAKIAVMLKNKTVRDVALRCKWMMKKDISRRRKDELSLRRSKERKDKATDPSAMSSQGLLPPGIDGITRELLRQNAQAFEQISANLANYQIQNNIGLFCQARDNISQILKRINAPPYIMKRMPELPVKVNEELASAFLPPSNLSMQ